MADINELRRLDAEIRVAECRAIKALAAAVRHAILDLPSQSPLGLVFLRHADGLEIAAGERYSFLEDDLDTFASELWGDER